MYGFGSAANQKCYMGSFPALISNLPRRRQPRRRVASIQTKPANFTGFTDNGNWLGPKTDPQNAYYCCSYNYYGRGQCHHHHHRRCSSSSRSGRPFGGGRSAECGGLEVQQQQPVRHWRCFHYFSAGGPYDRSENERKQRCATTPAKLSRNKAKIRGCRRQKSRSVDDGDGGGGWRL